jgi:hypothetical protein
MSYNRLQYATGRTTLETDSSAGAQREYVNVALEEVSSALKGR